MKITDEQKDELFRGMLEMLDPEATENVEDIQEIQGSELIRRNIFKDKKGNTILHGIKYLYSVTVTKRINHKQKMGHIIEGAANQTELNDRLGEYLAKYAKDPAAVIRSIPANKSAASIKKSDN